MPHNEQMTAYGVLLGRILLGAMFFISGTTILITNTIDSTASLIASIGLPFPLLLALVTTATKVVGGGALILGYRPRYAAAALIVFTALATLFFHMDINDPGLFKNLAVIGGLLYVAAYGGGSIAFTKTHHTAT